MQATFDFVIVAFALFLFVKVINTLKKQEAQQAPAPTITPSEQLLTEIRDLLKK
jgi:large conductance mechanosensitive channel